MTGILAGESDVFIVVDVQNDLCPGEALAVPHGDEVVAPINRLARQLAHVVLMRDWHPRGHSSFASNYPGTKPFETTTLSYGEQVLWPDHCVQATDSYSAFFENDRKTATGLAGYLRERGFTRVVLAGSAFDFCVRYSAEDARREGFAAVVIEDACRGIDMAGSVQETRDSLARLGVGLVNSATLAAA
jgi:nicotinamidase/pyrazinamidase